jgi:hypothetical protein
MRQATRHKRTHLVGSILIALAVAVGQVWAAEDISGEWESRPSSTAGRCFPP